MPSEIRSFVPTALLGILLLAGPSEADEPRFAPEQLRQDLAFVTSEVMSNHPDPAHSFDAEALAAVSRSLSESVTAPLTRDEAWRVFATLNPLLADGHLFIALPDWRGEANRYLKQGGSFFPFEVQLDADGILIVKAALGGAATPLAGARISAIDGTDSREIGRTLVARAHGDTPAFRAELVSRRFWFYYWKLYGTKPAFEIAFEDRPAQRVQASRDLPAFLSDEASFERQFHFAMLPCQAALLTLSSFSWPEKERFLAFTREAFSDLESGHIQTLIIDIRANGGGDDTFWVEGILPYIADRPYRWGSTFRKRVLEQYKDEGETTGDVVRGEIDDWIQPQPENPLRFSGKVHVLIGPSTYSSAVLFSNVIQDFDFGTVAGGGPGVRARQSGGVQRSVLPNTGLVLYWPRFVLDRPAGAEKTVFVTPDAVIPDDPLRPRVAVEQLVASDSPGCPGP